MPPYLRCCPVSNRSRPFPEIFSKRFGRHYFAFRGLAILGIWYQVALSMTSFRSGMWKASYLADRSSRVLTKNGKSPYQKDSGTIQKVINYAWTFFQFLIVWLRKTLYLFKFYMVQNHWPIISRSCQLIQSSCPYIRWIRLKSPT